MRCQRLAGRLRKARSPRGLTFVTWHSRSIGKAPRCSSTNLNRTAFGSRRTGWLFSRISPFRRENNPPDCFADPAQILEDADLAPKPLFSGQARGPRPRPHPCLDGRSPMGSRSTRRPQIIRNLTSRKPARPCNAHRILAKLIRPACAHGSSPLPHIVLSKERHQAATGPVGLRLVSCVT